MDGCADCPNIKGALPCKRPYLRGVRGVRGRHVIDHIDALHRLGHVRLHAIPFTGVCGG